MIVAFELEDGTVVEMEATGDPTEASVVPAGSGDRVAARAVVKLEAAIERLKLVHLIGTESFVLTATEFAATTGLDADTYEKAVAK